MSAAVRTRRALLRTAARARAGLPGARARPHAPDEAPLRRISWRLAALTVGLLCALLLVLGVILYVTMQTAVQDTMQQTLRARVADNLPFARGQLLPRANGPGTQGSAPGHPVAGRGPAGRVHRRRPRRPVRSRARMGPSASSPTPPCATSPRPIATPSGGDCPTPPPRGRPCGRDAPFSRRGSVRRAQATCCTARPCARRATRGA